jgi:hypothetical protein
VLGNPLIEMWMGNTSFSGATKDQSTSMCPFIIEVVQHLY